MKAERGGVLSEGEILVRWNVERGEGGAGCCLGGAKSRRAGGVGGGCRREHLEAA